MATALRAEEFDEEEKRLQAQLCRVEDQLKKCVADEDYQGAAVAKAEIVALTRARQGSRSATGLAASMRVEEVDEDDAQRQAELGRARDHLMKCLADEDYQAAADAQAHITALTSVGHGSRPARSHAAASSLGSRVE